MCVSPCKRVCVTVRTLGLFFFTRVTFSAVVFLLVEFKKKILILPVGFYVRLYNRSVCAKQDVEATKLWLCYIIRVVQWLLLKEPDSICPHLMFALGKANIKETSRKSNLLRNLTNTTQSLPLCVCICTGADHNNKHNFYMHPPPAKHVAICMYFMVCLIIHIALALNTIMVSTLVGWLCCYRQLAVFAKLLSLIFITNCLFRLLYLQI